MKRALHILATVRKPELMRAATLVFQTLRVGFPDADVVVWGNALTYQAMAHLSRFAEAVGGRLQNLPPTSHDRWIESLLQSQTEGFWICDTDVVFTADLESRTRTRTTTSTMMGRFEPEFLEEWTGTRHMARLHTAVMWLDAPRLRGKIREWMCRIPMPWRNTAEFDLVRQHFVPLARAATALRARGDRRETLFYDSCAGLWHALGGRAFKDEENACFEHLHCATYVDCMNHEGLQAFHQRAYANPKSIAGAQIEQEKYYAQRRPHDPFTIAENETLRRKRKKKGRQWTTDRE